MIEAFIVVGIFVIVILIFATQERNNIKNRKALLEQIRNLETSLRYDGDWAHTFSSRYVESVFEKYAGRPDDELQVLYTANRVISDMQNGGYLPFRFLWRIEFPLFLHIDKNFETLLQKARNGENIEIDLWSDLRISLEGMFTTSYLIEEKRLATDGRIILDLWLMTVKQLVKHNFIDKQTAIDMRNKLIERNNLSTVFVGDI